MTSIKTTLLPTADRLSADEPDEVLFRALAAATDERERDHLQDLIARRYTGLVKWIASRYASRAVDSEELEAVGFLGLTLAIQRFDAERGFDFAAFAKPTVQGEIRRYFRDKRRWIRLPRRLQETKAVIKTATETLTHELGRAPTVDELAQRLAVSPELVLEALTADDTFAPASIDAPTGSHDDGDYTIADQVGFTESRFELFEDCESVRPLISALPEREQRILYLRFFEEKTQSEIGAELGLSQMHVSRLLSRSLLALRTQLAAD